MLFRSRYSTSYEATGFLLLQARTTSTSVDYNLESNCILVGILGTFSRHRLPIECGFHIFDEPYEYEVQDYGYIGYP